MTKHILKFIFFLFSFGLLCLPLVAKADEFGLSQVVESAGMSTASINLSLYIGTIVGEILSFIGVLFFALMVFGGFMWMTARGNEEQTKKSLNTITAAVIGLVIIFSSYTIVNFVFNSPGVIKYAVEADTPKSSAGYCDSKDIESYCNRLTTQELCGKETKFCKWGDRDSCQKINTITDNDKTNFDKAGLKCRAFSDEQSCSNDITVGYCQWYGLAEQCKTYCTKLSETVFIFRFYATEWKFVSLTGGNPLAECIKTCEKGPRKDGSPCGEGFSKEHFCYEKGKISKYEYGSCIDGMYSEIYENYIKSTTDNCINQFDESACRAVSDEHCSWWVLTLDYNLGTNGFGPKKP